MWITITHIEGRLNNEPDELSRVFDDRPEWQLHPAIFKQIDKIYKPTIDLFASRINKQLTKYVSWQPDPQALAVDAFTIDWNDNLNFIFSPFSMLNRVLGKLETDKAEAIVIVPLWPTQSWFAKMLHLLTEPPRLLPRGRKQLILPFDPERTHPLWRKMQLLACRLSGDNLRNKEFRRNLRLSSSSHGNQPLGSNIIHTSKNGEYFAIEGTWIPLIPL